MFNDAIEHCHYIFQLFAGVTIKYFILALHSATLLNSCCNCILESLGLCIQKNQANNFIYILLSILCVINIIYITSTKIINLIGHFFLRQQYVL